MKRNLTLKETVVITSMLFGMFFGAGNLIFPAKVGLDAGSNMWSAFAGVFITAVGIPMLAVVGLGLSRSEGVVELSQRVSRKYSLFFCTLLYLTIGPLFAIPRCASTAFSVGAVNLLPQEGERLYLALFSLAFFAGAYRLAQYPGRFKDVMGKCLTPLLLALIAVMFVAGLVYLKEPAAPALATYQGRAALQGFEDGYQTMDTLAAIVFGIVIALNVKACGVEKDGDVAKETMKAGLIAGILLGVVYGSLAWLGAKSSALLEDAADGTQILSGLCLDFFGPFGALFLAVIFFVACFNVCTGLLSSCAAFVFTKTFVI